MAKTSLASKSHMIRIRNFSMAALTTATCDERLRHLQEITLPPRTL